MSIDFHAVSVELAVFKKYAGTRKLESLFWLADAVADVDADSLDAAGRRALFEQVKAAHRERRGESEEAEAELRDYEELIDRGELPADSLEMGREWQVFDASFEGVPDAPEILGKCFAGDHLVGEGLDALWGRELQELAAALADVQVEDEEYAFLLFELKAFYKRAADSDWAVIRGLV